MHLAHQRLAVGHRADRGARGLRVERVDDDPHQQDHRVVLDAAAEPHELGEHEVEDAEQQQRPHQLPEVAEHRAEELEPELEHGERPRQGPEPLRVAAERGRPAHRAQRRGGGIDDAHDAGTPSLRSIRSVCGMSTRPPLARAPVTTAEAMSPTRTCTSWPEPRRADPRRGVIAAGREVVVERDAEADALAGRERAGVLLLPQRRGRERDVAVVGAEREREDGVRVRLDEAHDGHERRAAALREHVDAVALAVLEPGVGDLDRAVALVRAVDRPRRRSRRARSSSRSTRRRPRRGRRCRPPRPSRAASRARRSAETVVMSCVTSRIVRPSSRRRLNSS